MSANVESAGFSSPEVNYRDMKRYIWLLYPVWLSFPVISVYLARTTGHSAWYWLTAGVVFVLVPFLDFVFGSNTTNVPEAAVDRLEKDRYYHWIPCISPAFHYLALFCGAWLIGTERLDWAEYAGITLSVALNSAYGLITAHELGHKRGSMERWLAKATLATGAYGVYMTDHNRGHHRDVATPEDSGSARFGEGFWYFMVARQIPHSTWSRPWALEKERLARKGKGAWSLENEVIQPALISLSVYGALIALYGTVVIPYLVSVAFTSYFYLALVDYIEHYGLLREKLSDGRYARVRPEHSWNTDHIVTNIMGLNSQRHSDHHAFPVRRYQVLRSFPNLPTMPTGYPGMFWLAIFPPIWRAVMYPRLLRLVNYDLNLVNVDPRNREELFRKYSRVPDRSAPGTAFQAAASYTEAERSLAMHLAPASAGSKLYNSVHKCPGCGYTYSERDGDPSQGFAAGTRWDRIPATWSCPDCAVRDKGDFIEIAANAESLGQS